MADWVSTSPLSRLFYASSYSIYAYCRVYLVLTPLELIHEPFFDVVLKLKVGKGETRVLDRSAFELHLYFLSVISVMDERKYKIQGSELTEELFPFVELFGISVSSERLSATSSFDHFPGHQQQIPGEQSILVLSAVSVLLASNSSFLQQLSSQ